MHGNGPNGETKRPSVQAKNQPVGSWTTVHVLYRSKKKKRYFILSTIIFSRRHSIFFFSSSAKTKPKKIRPFIRLRVLGTSYGRNNPDYAVIHDIMHSRSYRRTPIHSSARTFFRYTSAFVSIQQYPGNDGTTTDVSNSTFYYISAVVFIPP